MTSLWQSPAIIVAFLTWLSAPSASLGEASQREALRRQLVRPAAASLTNLGQPLEMMEIGAETPPAPPADRPTLPTGAPAGPVGPDGKPVAPAPVGPDGKPVSQEAPAPKNDEKAWRERMTNARTSLERNEFMAEAMQSRINALQTDAVNRDDPAQQLQLRQQLGKAMSELGRLKKQVESDRKAIADIQTDARRQGVPPGWIR
jgi:hypothetical protein